MPIWGPFLALPVRAHPAASIHVPSTSLCCSWLSEEPAHPNHITVTYLIPVARLSALSPSHSQLLQMQGVKSREGRGEKQDKHSRPQGEIKAC